MSNPEKREFEKRIRELEAEIEAMKLEVSNLIPGAVLLKAETPTVGGFSFVIGLATPSSF